MFENIYFNLYSIGWFVLFAFYSVAGFFCIIIKQKSKAAAFLGIGFIIASVASIAYTIAYSLYTPMAAIHRYFTITCITITTIFVGQMIFSFPSDTHPKIRKTFLIVTLSLILLAGAHFIIKSLSSEYIYNFDSHCWDFDLDDLSKKIGLLILFDVFITICIGIWRTITIKSNERFGIFLMTMGYIIASPTPALLNIVTRDGTLSRDVYTLYMIFLIIIGYFIIFISFINYTKDRTSFMGKIVIISLVTILPLFTILSYFTSESREGRYDDNHRLIITEMLEDKNLEPHNVEYTLEYSIADDKFFYKIKKGNWSIDLTPYKNQILNTVMNEKIKELPHKDFIKNLNKILDNSHPYFIGYKNSIIKHINSLPHDKQNQESVIAYLDTLKREILRYYNAINGLPNDKFKNELENYLKKNNKLQEFNDPVKALLSKTALQGKDLKREILYFFNEISPAKSRHYRRDTTGKNHFVSYLQVNTKTASVHETGFSYRAYRAYIHADSIRSIYLLGLVFLIVVIGFRFFFRGTLINPLYSLVQGLVDVGKGNYNINLPIKVEDEIGFLTHNFNTMVSTIKDAKKQIDDYTNNLEDKVKQRTEELEVAMEELESINDTLVQTRDKLWGEMQLAKKIQTVLLPRDPRMYGFEITAYMDPADDVGGDYYDIINCNNKDFLVIGDVSGHGVPAGLVMMMVQTCIKVTLDCNPGLSPKQLLSAINKTITQNIKQMGEDKYMTITVMASIDQGKFTFSGLHQDIMIYRSERNEVEVIETDGMWLGLMDNIQEVLKDDSFILNKGDTMLVYTDGIIEAWIKNDEGRKKMYGCTKLSSILNESGKEPIDIVKNNIVDSLKEYTCFDDVTFVIVRRIV